LYLLTFYITLTVPGLGPLVGALVATGIYKVLKWVKYEQFSGGEPDAVVHDQRESRKSLDNATMDYGRAREYV